MDDSITSNDVLLRFDEPTTTRAVVLEDDGRVAYAYLLDHEEVVGDVWLYNVAEPPDLVDWNDASQMPFLNPKSFCKAESGFRLTQQSAVECAWFPKGVMVSINGVLIARLEVGAKPGWSRLATRSGPLAKPLESKA